MHACTALSWRWCWQRLEPAERFIMTPRPLQLACLAMQNAALEARAVTAEAQRDALAAELAAVKEAHTAQLAALRSGHSAAQQVLQERVVQLVVSAVGPPA